MDRITCFANILHLTSCSYERIAPVKALTRNPEIIALELNL